MDKYSSAAYRSFKAFIGELTAVAAGMYVGIQEAIPIIEENKDSDPWKVAAKKHGIIVDGLISQKVINSSVRLNLVSLYSGFDLFMVDIRTAFNSVQGREWTQYDGDSPFTALGRNTKSTVDTHIERLGAHRIAAMDHYRLIRNAIAHPSPKALHASEAFVRENEKLLEEVRSEYGTRTAPNEINGLTFHDIKLLARIALDITKAIDELLDPGDLRFQELLSNRPINKMQSTKRRLNASIGWLKTEYGLNEERARSIVDQAGI